MAETADDIENVKPVWKLSLGLTAALIVLWAVIQLAVFELEIFPLTYVLPMLICVWTRDRLALWLMAGVFLAISSLKLFLILSANSLPVFEDWISYTATVLNILGGAVAIHVVIALRERVHMTMRRLQQAHEQLQEQSEELTQQNEELAQQNEEIQAQSEELAQQNEELQVQTEDIVALNNELSYRERLLQALLDSARRLESEQEIMRYVAATATELYGDAADCVVVYEKQNSTLLIRAVAGLEEHESVAEFRPAKDAFANLVIEEGRTACLEDVSLRKDIEILDVEGSEPFQSVLCAPMRVQGDPIGAVAVYSRRKQEWTANQFRLTEWLEGQCAHALETLRMQNELWRQAALLDLSPDSIICKKPDGTITLWNKGAETLYGWRREEALGRKIEDLLKTQLPQPVEEVNRQLQRDGEWSGEVIHFSKNCEEIVIQGRWQALHDDNGKVVEILESNIDITGRKRDEQHLRKLVDDLARSNRDLQQFAYVASHDLQEPLRQVVAFVQLLEKKYGQKLDEQGAEYMRFIVEGAKRMHKLILDLLAYSRVDLATAKVEQISLQDALEQAVHNLSVLIEENKATVTSDTLPELKADQAQLVQVFQNLIGNAIKFRGDKAPEVHVGVEKNKHAWIVQVSDNGIGFDPEHADKIFQLFQRLHTRDVYPGTGIGLTICKRVVERHGGEMWAESKPGQGASFYFSLPR